MIPHRVAFVCSERAGVCLHTPATFKAYYDLLYSVGIAPIAQLVEQLPLKETVPGSSPGRCTE